MSTDSADGVPSSAFLHWCESCGREELLDSRAAYESGWDFPPRLGTWGVISPRTCPDCLAMSTVWWALVAEKRSSEELTPKQLKTVARILDEVPPGTPTA